MKPFTREEDKLVSYDIFTRAIKRLSLKTRIVKKEVPDYFSSTYVGPNVTIIHTDRKNFGDSRVDSLEFISCDEVSIENLVIDLGLTDYSIPA